MSTQRPLPPIDAPAAPEHLEALRQHERALPPVPTVAMACVLVGAALAQVVCLLIAEENLRVLYHQFTVDMQMGKGPLAPAQLSGWESTSLKLGAFAQPAMPWVQNMGALFLYFISKTFSATARARGWFRRAFLALGGLGLAVALLPMRDEYQSWGMVAAAVGAIVAGLMLCAPSAPEP
ncbi:hypothetical protein OV207_07955 [Corallococcus sp. BB11-1]|uniref:hypothetical protein n=1 Tax=Corallococcus sp. BB11-1 TaxID=2996783 RepID=UPI002271436F|nr:hypothetical protein [Corallococcus sp. BB11-1]MCY1031386.1 hypothetical protein [Corallococcus sp. BB11-1]